MGIDARIGLLLPAQHATTDNLKLWSWDICERLGADKFYRPSVFRQAEVFEHIGDTWEQDGDPMTALPGYTWVEVHVWSRYYGPGYERGDILFINAVAQWCEVNILSVLVYYGGDSSGVCLKRYNAAARTKMLEHFFSPSGRDYFNDRGFTALTRPGEDDKLLRRLQEGPLSDCVHCVPTRAPRRHGWGGGGDKVYASYYCPGCGKTFETRDTGTTWTTKED